MNKSKFLKKSLAMILAVLLIVAMIPLGAFANELLVIDGTIKSIATDQGTLEGNGPSWTNTLAYDATSPVTLSVTLYDNSKYDVINYTVTDASGKAGSEEEAKLVAGAHDLEVDANAKKVTFYAATEDGKTKSPTTYTVSFTKPAPSGSVAIASAKTTDGIEATVDNSKKTINLVVPWGYTDEHATATLEIRLEKPVTDAPIAKTVTITIGEAEEVTLEAQNGDTDFYTITSSEMELPLTTLSVGGVDAVYDKENDVYVVSMPEGTELGKEMALRFRVPTTNGVALEKAEWNGTEVLSGQKPVVNETNTLVLTSNKDTSKTLDVNVEVAKSADTSIISFTATATNDKDKTFTEDGTVSGPANGQKLTVQLPHNSDLTQTTVAVTPAAKAVVRKIDNVVPTEANGVYTATVDLSNGKEVLVTVEAENGGYAYHRLTATTADKYNDSPAITGAVLKLGEKEIAGVVSGYSVSFTVPYATTADDVKDYAEEVWTKYTWTKTSATMIDNVHFAADPFTGSNTVRVTSDGGVSFTWSLKFTKEAAKTGKTLDSLAFSKATNSDDVTDDNTFKATVSGTKVSVKFPHSYEDEDPEVVTCYEIPEGAVFCYSDGDELIPYQSGYDEKTKDALEKENLPAVSDLAELKIVVLDETAAVALRDELVESLEDLAADTYKNHHTVYEISVDIEPPATGHTLNGLATKDGLVTSVVSAKAVAMTVPASYVGENEASAKPFFAVYDASKYAKVMAGSVELPQAPIKDSDEGWMKVVYDGEDYVLYVSDGTSYSSFEKITVISEAGNGRTNYDVSVKAAAAESGAKVLSLKVDGYAGVINGREISVTLPFNSDLTAVTVEYEVSKMATHTCSLEGKGVADPDDPTVTLYDVTEPFTITVTSEDRSTTIPYTVTVSARTQFTDVPAGAYYYDRVYQAAAAGIVNGYPDGTFKPDNFIKRKDFAVMVTKMLGVDTSSYTTTSFTDVANDYALDDIAFCAENNIISGRGNGIFDPDANITRQEAASIVARALKLTRSTTTTSFKDDAKIASWAKSAVAACAKAGIISGRTDGTFAPTENIKRCDAAIIMVRSLDK